MEPYFVITRDKPGHYNSSGIENLTVSLYRGDASFVGALPATSGQNYRQEFLTAQGRPSGKFHPLPEGVYDVGPLDWAHGVEGDYGDWISPGLGPVVAALNLTRDYWTAGGDFLYHLDGNIATAPGSAGCIVYPDMATLEQWVGWMRFLKPAKTYADWGLGTVKPPSQVKPPELEIVRYKLYHHPGASQPRLVVGRHEENVMTLRVDLHDGKLGVALNGKQLQVPKECPALTVDLARRMVVR